MRPRSITLGFLVLTTWLCAGSAFGQPAPETTDAVTIVRVSPASPATLEPGEDVEISFRYNLRARHAFRIFIRPMTGRELSSDYAASGSPLYDPGSGGGSASFTLKQAGRVDRLRIVVTEDGTDRHLHRSYVDVDYRFLVPLQRQEEQIDRPARAVEAEVVEAGPVAETAVEEQVELGVPTRVQKPAAQRVLQLPEKTLDQLGSYQPPYWRPLPGVDRFETGPTDDGIPPCFEVDVAPEECEEVAGRRVTESGVVIVDCANGSTWRTTPQGDVFTTPDGRSCRHLVMMARSGTALPPAEPPSDAAAADWAQQLNAWLEHGVANDLKLRIRQLLGDEHFANYEQLEADSTNNLYQKIDYRLTFLDKLREYP